MNAKSVIVGGGPVGTETARLLVAAGHEVTVVTSRRRRYAEVQRRCVDASDADALTQWTEGAVLFNCANPPDYTHWGRVWPPLSASLLTAAERTGATLVTASSLYGYGPVDTPMREGDPDRATDPLGRTRPACGPGPGPAQERPDPGGGGPRGGLSGRRRR